MRQKVPLLNCFDVTKPRYSALNSATCGLALVLNHMDIYTSKRIIFRQHVFILRKWYVSNALKIEVSISLRDSTTSLLVLRY